MTIFLVCLIILVWIALSLGIAILINEMQFQRVKRKVREDLRESGEVLKDRGKGEKDGLRRVGTKAYESDEELSRLESGSGSGTGVELWDWIERDGER